MSADSWKPDIGQFPYPPANLQVISPMFVGAMDLRWDDPSILNTGPNCPVVQACADLTLLGTPAVQVGATGTLTVLTVPVPAGTSVTIGGATLSAVAGARTPGLNNFNGSLGTADLIASEIQDAINDAGNTFQSVVTPSASGATVTLTAVPEAADGNGIVLSTSDALSILLSGTALSGGVEADTITIGGVATLTATDGPRTPGANDFNATGTTFDIAQSIADAFNDPLNIFTSLVTANAAFGKVTILAVPSGAKGNGIAVEVSNSTLMVLSMACLLGGSGIQGCEGKNNSQWNIVGINVYRSETGERGPYFRLNDIPIGTRFFRDWTDNILIEDEVVDWNSQWVAKGDKPNDDTWQFCTRLRPIVKHVGQAIAANSPADVSVSIDGQTVPVHAVFGPTGVVTLINVASFDIATERTFGPVLPKADGTSEVLVTYRYNRNLVKHDLEHKAKVFYRITTVAVDESGTSPTGLVETPLEWSPPKNVMEVEQPDYIWREAVARNRWVLEQGGERVKLFIKRQSGMPCPCRRDEMTGEYAQMPFDQAGGPQLGQAAPLGPTSPSPSSMCESCFGTGFVQGYEGPIDMIIVPDDAERNVRQTPIGRRLEHTYEVWTGPSPMLSQRDFIVKQTGERYSIGPVRRPSNRGIALQQHFQIGYLDEQDIRYRVPVQGITELPWPQTRTTEERTVCNNAAPHPVGFDYQASTMATEKDNIPDEREQRGRTPVWENINYVLPWFVFSSLWEVADAVYRIV